MNTPLMMEHCTSSVLTATALFFLSASCNIISLALGHLQVFFILLLQNNVKTYNCFVASLHLALLFCSSPKGNEQQGLKHLQAPLDLIKATDQA